MSANQSLHEPGELVVQADFSENYAFVVQDASQSFHWNNTQATVHPFVIYVIVLEKRSNFAVKLIFQYKPLTDYTP